MQKVFSNKLDLKLIKLVKDHPELYDSGNPKYMDFNAREVAWQKIGDALEKPAADCKVRWINIRDVQRRILRKSISSSNKPKRAYKYDKHLEFIKNYYKDVSVSNEEESGAEDNDETSAGNDLLLGDDKTQSSDEADSKNIKKRKRSYKSKKQNFEAVEVPDGTMTEPATELDVSDPVEAFLISIGFTLKTFSPYHLNLAKSEIFNKVQELDLQQIVERQPRSDTITITSEGPMYYQG